MAPKRTMALAAITFTALIWGLSFLSIKIAVGTIPPMTLALARFIIASLVLVVLLKWLEPGARLARRDMPLMALTGIIGVTAYFYFENTGVKLTTASSASMIIATIPILTLLADFIFCGNKLSAAKVASVVFSTVGAYLIIAAHQEGSGSLQGNLLMVGAAVAWVAYTLATRPLSGRYSQLAVVTYQTLFGTAALVPFAFMEHSQWQPVNSWVVFHVFFLGLFCSALGYYLYVYAMEELGVSLVSLFINLVPVVAVASGYFLLKEPVTLRQIIGGAIIIAAVYLASWEKKASPEVPAGKPPMVGPRGLALDQGRAGPGGLAPSQALSGERGQKPGA